MKTIIIKSFNYFSKFLGAALLLSALLSTNVLAESAAPPAPKLTVTGNGLLKVSPDVAYLNVGVRTTDSDVETASLQNIEITQKIVESLSKMGIDKKDIKTQNYNVYPSYDYSMSDGENKITGYEVTNSLSITIRKIDDVGKIIDECISSGSNMMNGLNYSVETPSLFYGQLFQNAVADAQKKATAISEALKIELSSPVSITEGGYSAFPTYMNVGLGMAGEAAASKQAISTYTAPGDIELSAAVVVVYEYKQP